MRKFQLKLCSAAAMMAFGLAPSYGAEAPASKAAADSRFIVDQAPLIAITHVNLIDGTGGTPKKDVTLVIENGRFKAVGPAKTTAVPANAKVIDGTGKTVTPGFVLMHEHLFYPVQAQAKFAEYPLVFAQLYLAGGETTIRTIGSLDPMADLAVSRDIEANRIAGPELHVTGAYLNGQVPIVDRQPTFKTNEELKVLIDYWANQGVTSMKAYQYITRDHLKFASQYSHSLGLPLAIHACAVTAREAAEIGVDSLEHGFLVFTDFTPNKKPDECPALEGTYKSIVDFDPAGRGVGDLIDLLIKKKVAITSTMMVAETFYAPSLAPNIPGMTDLLGPEIKAYYEKRRLKPAPAQYHKFIGNIMAAHLRFLREGGLLMNGTDPTTSGIIPGFAAFREYELMIEHKFTPAEAMKVMTLNGAKHLGRDKEIGSVEIGKQADLLLFDGDLVANDDNVYKLKTVFRAGIGYDRKKILDFYAGKIDTAF